MEELVNMGFISIIPPILAIVLSFATKNTIVSLGVACLTGTLLAGQGLFGFPTLLKESLGTTSFSWVMLLNIFIGILVAYFQKTGAIQGFSQWVNDKKLSRKGAQLMAWVLGMFVYFSDSFSPLFVGCTMRSITDKARISREKLAYIADSTSAPVSVLVPITGWAAYLSGLAVGVGCIATEADGAALFIKAIPFNFYAIIAVLFVGLIASGIVKDFGPMKKAEKRAMEEGKVLADGAEPLTGRELTEMQPYPGFKPRVFLNFVLPVLMIISTATGNLHCLQVRKDHGSLPLCGNLYDDQHDDPGHSLQGSNEDHDGRHQGRTARRCAACHGILHQRSEQADGNRELYYFHLRRLHDPSCASRADLCCGSNHGIRDRNLLGNLRDLYAHCSASGIQLQRR